MAKISKSMLKGIVKECLVEILAEGLGDVTPLLESKKTQRSTARPAPRRGDSVLDQMDRSFAKKKPSFGKSVSSAAAMATDDPVLQSILADTAKTTLQEQLRHEPRHSVSSMASSDGYDMSDDSGPMASSDPGLDIDSLFGDLTNNWSEVLERSVTKKLP